MNDEENSNAMIVFVTIIVCLTVLAIAGGIYKYNYDLAMEYVKNGYEKVLLPGKADMVWQKAPK